MGICVLTNGFKQFAPGAKAWSAAESGLGEFVRDLGPVGGEQIGPLMEFLFQKAPARFRIASAEHVLAGKDKIDPRLRRYTLVRKKFINEKLLDVEDGCRGGGAHLL